MKQTKEQKAVREARAEVALAKRLITLLDKPGVAWFFEPHPEHGWYEGYDVDAWEAWVKAQLSEPELEIYRDRFEHEFSSMADFRQHVAIESNRIPELGNIDGY